MRFCFLLLNILFTFKIVHAQTHLTHTIEVNFDFNFSQNKVRILYIISPPDIKESFEYNFAPYNIQDFRSFVLKPGNPITYQLDDNRLRIQHSGYTHHKYQFYSDVQLDQLVSDQLLIVTSKGYEFKYSEFNANKIFLLPVKGMLHMKMSVCSDYKISSLNTTFISFADSKNFRECKFSYDISAKEVRSIRISFDKPFVTVYASSSEKQTQTARQATENSTVSKPEDYKYLLSENLRCNTIDSTTHPHCIIDSLIVPTVFFTPFNTHYFLTAHAADQNLFCIKSKWLSCEDQNQQVIEFLMAYEIMLELLKEKNKKNIQLKIRNIVDNHTKNSGYTNAIRLYYFGLIYNLYYHNGTQAIEKLFQLYLSQYSDKSVFDVIRELNLITDYKKPDNPVKSKTPFTIQYELNYNIKSGGYVIKFSDPYELIKPGTKLTWIAYLKNQRIDTVNTITNGSGQMIFEVSSDAEILFLYPQWEELFMIPTEEKRPDFHAILELNHGYTPLNRYRAFRTMISTGNPNLLATAVSLALDDSLPQIQSIGFDRLDEVPEHQIRKIKDGLLRGLAASDAFTRPTAYRNAERFELKVQRPVISDQKKSDLYADLLVLKQFEGLRAIDVALESFIEGNNDEGLIWFLAENGEKEVIDLLLTFESEVDIRNVLKRLLIVHQARTLTAVSEKNEVLSDYTKLLKRLNSAGISEDTCKFLLSNLEMNLKLFKASFTNPYTLNSVFLWNNTCISNE